MSGHFSGGCRFEGGEEHERSFAQPWSSPFQQENQGFFRQAANSPFNRSSYPMPEIVINMGSEPQAGCGPYGNMPGNPQFYGRNNQWANNYNNANPNGYNDGNNYYGNPNNNNGYDYLGNPINGGGYNYPGNPVNDGGYNYSGNPNNDANYNNAGNPNNDGSYNYPANQNNDGSYNYSGNPNVDSGSANGNSNGYASDTGVPQRTSADVMNDVDESGPSDVRVAAPSSNNGLVAVAPADATAVSDQVAGPAATPGATTDATDITAQMNWIASHVPLATADSAGFLTSPPPVDGTNSTDQTVSPAPASTDQTVSPAPVSTDQTAGPGSPAAPPGENDTLPVASVYGVPNMAGNTINSGNKN